MEQLRLPVDFERNRAIVEALAEEAVALGVFHRSNPMEGIEAVIKLALNINGIRSTGSRDPAPLLARLRGRRP